LKYKDYNSSRRNILKEISDASNIASGHVKKPLKRKSEALESVTGSGTDSVTGTDMGMKDVESVRNGGNADEPITTNPEATIAAKNKATRDAAKEQRRLRTNLRSSQRYASSVNGEKQRKQVARQRALTTIYAMTQNGSTPQPNPPAVGATPVQRTPPPVTTTPMQVPLQPGQAAAVGATPMQITTQSLPVTTLEKDGQDLTNDPVPHFSPEPPIDALENDVNSESVAAPENDVNSESVAAPENDVSYQPYSDDDEFNVSMVQNSKAKKPKAKKPPIDALENDVNSESVAAPENDLNSESVAAPENDLSNQPYSDDDEFNVSMVQNSKAKKPKAKKPPIA